MCGRYGLFPPAEEIGRLFGLDGTLEYTPSFNIAPSQAPPAVVSSREGPRIGPLRWGLHVGGVEKGRIQINARSETVHTRGVFKTALERRRCVLPASGFYEWRKETEGEAGKPVKVPHWIHAPSGEPLLMAGIWGRDPKLEADDMGEPRQRYTGTPGFAILTRSATDELRTIHARMPVLLTPIQAEQWLDRDSKLAGLREVFAASRVKLTAYPVSTLVNRPANDDPELLAPVGPPLF